MSKRQRKFVRKPAKRVTARRGSPAPGTTPVEKAWLEFVDKFQAFTAKPHNEENKEAHKAWEKALRTADNAACAVMAEAATCLSDMELKIQAWAFRSAVEKRNDLAGLANWQPREGYESDSVFIASLRDDIRLIETSIGTAEDPELIKLGEQLDQLAGDWTAEEEFDKRNRHVNSEGDPDPDLRRWSALQDRLCTLVKPIFALTARTAAGLAIQTKVVTMACPELWGTKVAEEGELEVERVFIEAVCRYAGVAVPARRDDC